MKVLKYAIPAAVLMLGLNLRPSQATVDIGKKEKKACTVCHVSMKSKDLNDVGKCYKEKQSLTGCVAKK